MAQIGQQAADSVEIDLETQDVVVIKKNYDSELIMEEKEL